MRARALRLVVVGSACLLMACGDDEGDASAGSETTQTTSAEEARAELEAEIVAAYEEGWNALIRAGDPPDPDAAHLADALVGEQLERSQGILHELGAEGLVVRGTYEFDAAVTELGDDTATVEDCGLNQLEEIVPESGEIVETFDDQRDGIVADLALDGGRWKVSDMNYDDEVCER
jgi:hypothetical protein